MSCSLASEGFSFLLPVLFSEEERLTRYLVSQGFESSAHMIHILDYPRNSKLI